MNLTPSFTFVDGAAVAAFIEGANRKVVFMAPAIDEKIAAALADAFLRLGTHAVQVILDMDPEVYRLGYGTTEGLLLLHKAVTETGIEIRRQTGVRLGVVVADDATLIYAPTPLLVEAGAGKEECPNALVLDAIPREIATDLGANGNPQAERIIGVETTSPAEVDRVVASLKANPPVKFDLARKVRVFSMHFEYVELEVKGCSLSRRKVPIPNSLMGLAHDRDIEEQISAHFNLIDATKLGVEVDGRKITQRSLQDSRNEIGRQFLVTLKGYGQILHRTNRTDFQKAIENLRGDVKEFGDGVREALQKTINESVEKLTENFLQAVIRNPPAQYVKIYGKTLGEEQARHLLKSDFAKSFGEPEKYISDMAVNVVFKAITIESLTDEEFLKAVRNAMPNDPVLHDEYKASPVLA